MGIKVSKQFSAKTVRAEVSVEAFRGDQRCKQYNIQARTEDFASGLRLRSWKISWSFGQTTANHDTAKPGLIILRETVLEQKVTKI